MSSFKSQRNRAVVVLFAVAALIGTVVVAQPVARVAGGGTGDIVQPDWGTETQFGIGATVSKEAAADGNACLDKFQSEILAIGQEAYEEIYPPEIVMPIAEMIDLVEQQRGDWYDARGHFMCKLVAEAPKEERPSEKYFVVINMDTTYGRVNPDGSVLFCGEHMAIDGFTPRVTQVAGVSLLRVWKEDGVSKFWYVDQINVAYGGDFEDVVSGNLQIKLGRGR